MAVYIIDGARTPQGSFLGNLSQLSAPKLGAIAIKKALERSNLTGDKVDEVIMGQVIQAGVGQAPARQAAIFAGLDESTPCVSLNKVCGSGMQATIFGAKSIMTKDADLVVSGGMENMSLAPHFMHIRSGVKFGQTPLKDSMQWDGLWDVYSDRAMGNCAEECVTKYQMSREDQDQFAVESFQRALEAQKKGVFAREIAPVHIQTKKGEIVIEQDEGPSKVNFEKIPSLRPAFEKTGSITAANASTINDGAAALVLGSDKYKDQAKFKILGWATHAQNPTWFTTAPVEAMKKNLSKLNLNIGDIDYFEINEAFAVVTLVAMKELEIPREKVNIYGGGISLGHPIGCSGARIILTLMNVLERQNAKRGLASLCIGGGEALSMVIEKL